MIQSRENQVTFLGTINHFAVDYLCQINHYYTATAFYQPAKTAVKGEKLFANGGAFDHSRWSTDEKRSAFIDKQIHV